MADPQAHHAKDAELMNGRGAVHKATDLVQPSWRASDVDVKSVKRTVKEYANSTFTLRPFIAVGATVGAIAVGAIGALLMTRNKVVPNSNVRERTRK